MYRHSSPSCHHSTKLWRHSVALFHHKAALCLHEAPFYHHNLHCDITVVHCFTTVLHWASPVTYCGIITLHFWQPSAPQYYHDAAVSYHNSFKWSIWTSQCYTANTLMSLSSIMPKNSILCHQLCHCKVQLWHHHALLSRTTLCHQNALVYHSKLHWDITLLYCVIIMLYYNTAILNWYHNALLYHNNAAPWCHNSLFLTSQALLWQHNSILCWPNALLFHYDADCAGLWHHHASCDITVLHSLMTILYCAVPVLNCDITMLHFFSTIGVHCAITM